MSLRRSFGSSRGGGGSFAASTSPLLGGLPPSPELPPDRGPGLRRGARPEPLQRRRGPVRDRQVGGRLAQEGPDRDRVEVRREREADGGQAANRGAGLELGTREPPLIVLADREERSLRRPLPHAGARHA